MMPLIVLGCLRTLLSLNICSHNSTHSKPDITNPIVRVQERDLSTLDPNLRETSPSAPEGNDCGELIGAVEVGCP